MLIWTTSLNESSSNEPAHISNRLVSRDEKHASSILKLSLGFIFLKNRYSLHFEWNSVHSYGVLVLLHVTSRGLEVNRSPKCPPICMPSTMKKKAEQRLNYKINSKKYMTSCLFYVTFIFSVWKQRLWLIVGWVMNWGSNWVN